MAESHEPLGSQIHFVVTDQELDETWQRLDGSLRPERSIRRWVVLTAALAAVALAIGVVAFRSTNDGPILEAGTAIATGTAPLIGALREGSTIRAEVSSSGAVEVASTNLVRVRVDRGVMRFDVAKKTSRQFSVVAGDVEVRVVGTRFVVRREATSSVQVERGVVEIWEKGEQRAVLTAGQSWEQPRQAEAALPTEPSADLEEGVDEVEAADEPETAVAPSKPTKRKGPRHSKRAPTAAKDEPLPPPVGSTEPSIDPAALFRTALDARRAGQASDAARAFRAFLQTFPDDSRAGLAHFELGRLEMDQLKSPSSAIESLERSIARSPSGSHVEDAMARLVRLHDQLRHPACQPAKAAYLRRFPTGVHAATLDALCAF